MKKHYAEILELKKQDARYTAAKIAVMLGLNEKEVEVALSEMEADGTIVKYTVLTNDEIVEKDTVEALIEVKVTPQRNRGFDAIAEDIYSFNEVKSVYLMSGGYDLTVVIEGKNLRQVAMFVSEKLSTLDTVVGTSTHFILKKYKIDGVIMNNVSANKRISIHP